MPVCNSSLRSLPMVGNKEARVGEEYQAKIPPLLPSHKEDIRDKREVETLMWEPERLQDCQIEQYLFIAKSVGTFARAVQEGSRKGSGQACLRQGASAASRDVTLFHAMDTLHRSGYDVGGALGRLVPRGPVLLQDELEAWSQDDARRFETGLREAKDFYYINKKHLPGKSVKSIVSYYYFWKTSDRYQIRASRRLLEKQCDRDTACILYGPDNTPLDLNGGAAGSGDCQITSAHKHKGRPTNIKTLSPLIANDKG